MSTAVDVCMNGEEIVLSKNELRIKVCALTFKICMIHDRKKYEAIEICNKNIQYTVCI